MTDPDTLRRFDAFLAVPGRRILGIAGLPGSGKSTLAEHLSSVAGAVGVAVPMDGFHLASRELERLGRSGRKGAPDTFDVDGYVALLSRLRRQSAGEIVYAPAFDRNLEEPIAGEIGVTRDSRVVITEGNYLLMEEGAWVQVRPMLDEVWFVDVDNQTRLAWLLARHMRYGRSREDALHWIATTDEPNARRIALTAHRADFRVQIISRKSP